MAASEAMQFPDASNRRCGAERSAVLPPPGTQELAVKVPVHHASARRGLQGGHPTLRCQGTSDAPAAADASGIDCGIRSTAIPWLSQRGGIARHGSTHARKRPGSGPEHHGNFSGTIGQDHTLPSGCDGTALQGHPAHRRQYPEAAASVPQPEGVRLSWAHCA